MPSRARSQAAWTVSFRLPHNLPRPRIEMRPIRWVQRGVEAVDLVSRAADAASRRKLFAAYVALLKRAWNPSPFEIQLRLEGRIAHLRLRQRDIYVLGEILHD